MANTTAGFTPVAQTDVFDPASDINRAELFVEKRLTDGASNAAALPTLFPAPVVGEERWVTADHCFYVWDGTQWSALNVSAAITSFGSSSITAGSSPNAPTVTRIGFQVFATGILVNTNTGIGTGTIVCTVPAGFRPTTSSNTRPAGIMLADYATGTDGLFTMTIDSTGALKISGTPGTLQAATSSLWLNGLTWMAN